MGGKYRHRVHGKAMVKVKKGMTSESNPTSSKHRNAAMAARNASVMTANLVAVDDRPAECDTLLEGLDCMNIGTENNMSSSKSMVSEGGLSRISEFTSCTNPAFDSVHRVWKSGSSIQKEVLSVLAAVTEVIKERNGSETDVEYFAALLTALESAPLGESPQTAATAFLLQMIVKRVPKEVLQSQFTKTVQILYTKLLEYNTENSDGLVLKNLLSCLGLIIRAQPIAVWQSSTLKNIVITISSLCVHEKPWVRTMSRRVVRAVLTDPVTSLDNGLHPCSAAVGQFVKQALESALSAKNGAIQAVRYLCLLEGIMHKMPLTLFQQLSESILKSFAFADPMVKCSSLQCLLRALQRQPCDAALSDEVNVRLIIALKQLAPPATDIAVTAYWMQALAEALVCLTAKNPDQCYGQLMPCLQLFVKTFDVANDQLAQVAYQVISRLIERCIQDHEASSRALLVLLDESLKLQSTSIWKFVLRTLRRLYESVGEALVSQEFNKSITSLAELRQSDQCFCKQEIDFTIGAAVRYVGVEAVLNVLSLGVDADAAVLSTDFSRSWLIPVLRVNIQNAPLALFSSFFLPIAIKIYRRLPTMDDITRRLYTTYQMQLWELLPSFCESPSDLEKSFPDLAPVLGAALNERKDLRLCVLTALRRALKFALQSDAPAERVEVMARYAKNYMPLLFNMYSSSVVDGEYDDKSVRLAVLETIRVYAEATPDDLLTRFVNSAISKWSEASQETGATAEDKQARILDILCSLVRAANSEAVIIVMAAIHPWFSSTSMKSLQKKAYRILEEILARRSSPDIGSVVEKRQDDIDNALQRHYASVMPNARAAYISCLMSMFDWISGSGIKIIAKFCLDSLDFVVLSLDKNNNVHTRTNASKMLQMICVRLIETGAEQEEPETPSNMLGPILGRIFEIATPQSGNRTDVGLEVARSTLVALNIIVQKQLKVLNATHTSRIISHACSWIGDGRPPVRILAIRLLRILVKKLPEFAMHQYRELLLTSIFDGQLTADVTVKVRKANRLLLEVLVERFGCEVLEKYTKKPEWLKQMKNIEKLRRRKAAKARGETVEPDSDDDGASAAGSRTSARTAGADTILELLEESENEDDSDAEMETRSRTGSVWLRENDGDEVTDLLDKSDMINKYVSTELIIVLVTTTDPALVARRKAKALESKKDSGFKFTKEGKIIILDDDEDIYGNRRKRKNVLDDMDDSGGQKKRKDDSDAESDPYEDSDSEDDSKSRVKKGAKSTVSAASSYRTGGQGIHRNTSRDKGQKKGGGAKPQKGVQPYAYVPLRQKGAKQDVRKLLKAQRKSGKNKPK